MSNNNNNNTYEEEMPLLELLNDESEVQSNNNPASESKQQKEGQGQQPPKYEIKNDIKVIFPLEKGPDIEIIVPFQVANYFGTLRSIAEDMEEAEYIVDNGIPLPGVSSPRNMEVLIKYYLERQKNLKKVAEATGIQPWELEFFNGEVGKEKYESYMTLIQDSNYLDCKETSKVCIKLIALPMKDATPEKIREIANITTHFTEDQERWAREKAIEMFE